MGHERAIAQQAAEWFATLRDGPVSDDDRRRWQSWLAADPEHARIWQRVEAISQPFAHLAAPPSASAVQGALSRAHNSGRRRAMQLLGFAGLALGSGLLLRQTLPWENWLQTYAIADAGLRTGIGEQRSLKLEDGTQLSLNTATAVDLDYGAHFRRVVLRDGEILLDSAPDHHLPARPLVVDTLHGRLTALGTRFTVRGGPDRTLVAVYEGRVRISPGDGGPDYDVVAGEQANFTPRNIEPAGPAERAREGWARGLLIADNIRLDSFVAELSRYTPIRLEITDGAAELRLLAVYPITRPDRDIPRILVALETVLPVRVRHLADGALRIESPPMQH